MSKVLELAKKLKALADKGIGGERLNAERMLGDLLKKHGIAMSDIELDEEKDFFVTIPGEITLFFQLANVVRHGIKVSHIPDDKVKEFKLAGNVLVVCNHAQFIEIEAKYAYYSRLYKEELDIFYTAFLKANNLLIAPGDDDIVPPMNMDQMKKWSRIDSLSKKITVGQFNKQLS